MSLTVATACAAQLALAWSLWEAMGIAIMPVVTLFVAGVTVLVLAPSTAIVVEAGRRAPFVGFAVAGVCLMFALFLPAYSDESPRALNFYFVQDADAGEARLMVSPGRTPLPELLQDAVQWRETHEKFYPWQQQEPQHLAVGVEAIAEPPPQLEVLEQRDLPAGRRLRVRLVSPREAARAAVVFQQPERIESLHVEGWRFDLATEEIRSWYPDGHRVIRFATVPPEGIELSLELRGDEPFEVHTVDYSFGLPPPGEVLRTARPSNTVPIGQGDLTVVHARSDL